MSDTGLLILGIVVFGLMATGMVLTVIEFKRLSEEDQAKSTEDSSNPRPVSNDRD